MNKSLKVVMRILILIFSSQTEAALLTPSAGSAYMSCTPASCQITPNPVSDLSPPVTGFSFVVSATRPLTMNNVYTGFTDKLIGNVLDVVWRNSTTPVPTCIYGTKVTLSQVDYDVTLTGNQYFDMRDIARGGYATMDNLDVAYSRASNSTLHPSRVGRTYTSVSATGLPPFGASTSIAATAADINDNWVNFTTRAIARTGVTLYPSSVMAYVTATCDTSPPAVVSGAIRLRQTIAPFIQISAPGFVPPAGTATPAAIVPY